MWWAVTTTTTVGYGDIYPATDIGRFVAIFVMVVGIGSSVSSSALCRSGSSRPSSSRRRRKSSERSRRTWAAKAELLEELRAMGDRLRELEGTVQRLRT